MRAAEIYPPQKRGNMRSIINLHGEFRFAADEDKCGLDREYYLSEDALSDTIILPATTSSAGKGRENTSRETGFLTDCHPFCGWAWYSCDVTITPEQRTQHAELFIERTRTSHVWVDGIYAGTMNSLCTSHRYDLTGLFASERCRLTIMVDNSSCPTAGGHMTSQDTQTNWNGILGRLDLIFTDELAVISADIYPNVSECKARIEMNVRSDVGRTADITVSAVCGGFSAGEIHLSDIPLKKGENILSAEYSFGSEALLWDEYERNIYTMTIAVSCGELSDSMDIKTALRSFTARRDGFYINGRRTFLRGKHDALLFPLTGYAPMDAESWRKVFSTAKEYGINHYRFHTCCPPEAAFAAADELGIFMQPELPFWGTIKKPETEAEMTELEYLTEEGRRILREFGNHPSFVMMSLGNELWGDKEVLNDILGEYKLDGRRLYTQGSNNFQFCPCILENDDFFSGVRFSRERLIRGSYAMCDAPQGHIQTAPPDSSHRYDDIISPEVDDTSSDGGEITIQYGTGIKKVSVDGTDGLIPEIPVISHEIGQYEMYPDFGEIQKYTGVLRADNLAEFRRRAEEKGIIHRSEHYFRSSGMLAADCYKAELESALKSEKLSGFQLLDLQDFTGQGTALVGILNSFMENKGIISAEKWRRFCSDAVIMASLDKFVFTCGEQMTAQIILAQYRREPPALSTVTVTLSDDSGELFAQQTAVGSVAESGVRTLFTLEYTMPERNVPAKLTLHVTADGTGISNEYPLWLFPEKAPECTACITSDKAEAERILHSGGSVVYLIKEQDIPQNLEGCYCTDFWNYPMFSSISESMGRPLPTGTLGLCIDNTHPALAHFPCESYTTPQWYEIIVSSRAVILDGTGVEPIAAVIDNVGRNHNLGLIYEVRSGNGRMLVCSSQLRDCKGAAAKWLLYSLSEYCSRADE